MTANKIADAKRPVEPMAARGAPVSGRPPKMMNSPTSRTRKLASASQKCTDEIRVAAVAGNV
jgi:hypothetical protein